MSDTYLVVGIHGAPTPETAPHGFRYQSNGEAGWWVSATINLKLADPLTRWQPLPAPPTEQAPPPEPMAPWSYGRDQVYSMRLKLNRIPPIVDHEEAVRYRDALNALDRDGVAWGPGRPMAELPDTHPRVMIRSELGTYIASNTCRLGDAGAKRLCWWPLPGEAQ